MLKNREFDLNNNNHGQFPTIDDAFSRVEEEYLLLRKVRAFTYPLAVRRGIGKRSGAVTPSDENRTLRAKGRTYFFDIKHTSS
jgi:hypothetical protein